MAPAGLPMAIVVSALALFLVWRYRENFAGLVRPPRAGRTPENLKTHSQLTATAGFEINQVKV
jgi:hypothetical protein